MGTGNFICAYYCYFALSARRSPCLSNRGDAPTRAGRSPSQRPFRKVTTADRRSSAPPDRRIAKNSRGNGARAEGQRSRAKQRHRHDRNSSDWPRRRRRQHSRVRAAPEVQNCCMAPRSTATCPDDDEIPACDSAPGRQHHHRACDGLVTQVLYLQETGDPALISVSDINQGQDRRLLPAGGDRRDRSVPSQRHHEHDLRQADNTETVTLHLAASGQLPTYGTTSSGPPPSPSTTRSRATRSTTAPRRTYLKGQEGDLGPGPGKGRRNAVRRLRREQWRQSDDRDGGA